MLSPAHHQSRVRAAVAWTCGAALVALTAVPASGAGPGDPGGRADGDVTRERSAQASAAIAALPDRGPVRVVSLETDGSGRPQVEVVEARNPAEARVAIEELRADPQVTAVELDALVTIADHPRATDPLRAEQWAMDTLRAEHLWAGSRGRDVVIAVVDSGVDGSHPDLATRLVPGKDWVDPAGTGATDPNGHGTHVAGIAVASDGNGVGTVGLAPDARVMPLRVLDANGLGNASDLAMALLHAADSGAHVVNLSVGLDVPSQAVSAAIGYLLSRNVTVVAASGNQRAKGSPAMYPAAEPGVIAVAATTRQGVSASFSTVGTYVALSAPGEDVLSAVPAGRWGPRSGTSMAAPHVSAAVAALLQLAPSLTPAQVRSLLTSTARDLEAPGTDPATGAGLVDPVAAVAALSAGPPPVRWPALPRDWDGDRRADVVAVDATGRMWLYPGAGGGSFAPRRAIGSGWTSRDLVTTVGDWDGDGRPDLLARAPSNGDLWLYRGDGAGGFVSWRVVGRGWNGMDALFSPGDWDGDGAVDLLARRRSDGALILYPGDGAGSFRAARAVGNGWQSITALVVTGDWDGNGAPDFAARDQAGYLYLYSGTGTGGFSGRQLIGRGWQGFSQVYGPGDFDTDRRSDLLAVAADGGLWLYPGDGRGGFHQPRRVGAGWSPFRIVS